MKWAFFNRIVCLTVQDTEWQQGHAEFTRVGLTAEKFQAVKEIGPHQSFSHSERDILLDFYHSDAQTLLHLEDDCVFRELDHLETALSELPEDWDIVYLGANIRCDPVRYSEHLFRVSECWTTHAIGYNKKVVRFLLEQQPGFSDQMFDNWMGSRLGELNAFVVAPMVAWQRPHWSLIWDREVNYDDVFEESEAKLR